MKHHLTGTSARLNILHLFRANCPSFWIIAPCRRQQPC